ncbi:hypothetical protein [Nostoc sp.]|uniref:hypothetical protein n=1 Tax=Nostoc sp. TaxID=1180 RepID=UPI002FF75C78
MGHEALVLSISATLRDATRSVSKSCGSESSPYSPLGILRQTLASPNVRRGDAKGERASGVSPSRASGVIEHWALSINKEFSP